MTKPHDRSTIHSILAYHAHRWTTHLHTHTHTIGLSRTCTHAQFTLHDNLIPISPSQTLIFSSHLPPPSLLSLKTPSLSVPAQNLSSPQILLTISTVSLSLHRILASFFLSSLVSIFLVSFLFFEFFCYFLLDRTHHLLTAQITTKSHI